MIWTGLRTDEGFDYVRVKWPTLEESTRYGNITGGSIGRSYFSSTKALCNFSFNGGDAPNTVDAVRIYYHFTDENGERVREALGTFLVTYADIQHTNTDQGVISSGDVQGVSVLSVLANAIAGVAYSFEAGTKTVDTAAEIAGKFGLKVQRDESEHTLSNSHVFEPDDNYLTIINWLLAQAGFMSADVDAYGNVLMRKQTNATGATYTFEPGEESVLYPTIKESNDYMTTPNVVRVFHETDEFAAYAYAKLIDGNKSALNNRGNRELTMFESVSEVDGETSAAKLQALKDYAKKVLEDNSNEIVKLEWRHPYLPIQCGQAVRVNYGKTYDMTVTNMSISLAPATQTVTNGRAVFRYDLNIETGGEVIWEA